MNKFYIKVGKRYKCVSTGFPEKVLPMGVYAVRDGGDNITNIDYYSIRKNGVTDIIKTFTKIELADIIGKTLYNNIDKGKSLLDMSMKIAEDIINKSEL